MKKFLLACITALLLVSCFPDRSYETTITYKVYYPGNTVTRSVTHATSKEPVYYLSSDRGSNYLYFKYDDGAFAEGEKLESTSAPIEVVSFTKRKK